MSTDSTILRSAYLSLFAPTVIDASVEVIDAYGELITPLFAGDDFFVTRIDPNGIRNQDQLFSSICLSCGFPNSFGFNWDALKDSLLDFSWMNPKPSGFLLLYRDPSLLNWSDLSEFIILADRVRAIYAQHRKPFKVLMGQVSAT